MTDRELFSEIAELREQAVAARKKVEVLQPPAVRSIPTQLPAGKAVVRAAGATVGYEPGRPVVSDLSFEVSGRNGSGKTTPLSLVTGRPSLPAGSVQVTTAFADLDQRASVIDPGASVRNNFRRLNPQADARACRAGVRAGVARPASRPGRTDEPTGCGLDRSCGGRLRTHDGAFLVVGHDETLLYAARVTRRIEL